MTLIDCVKLADLQLAAVDLNQMDHEHKVCLKKKKGQFIL